MSSERSGFNCRQHLFQHGKERGFGVITVDVETNSHSQKLEDVDFCGRNLVAIAGLT